MVEIALDGPVNFSAVAKELFPWLDNAKAWLTKPVFDSLPLTPAKGMGGLLTFLLVLFLRTKLTALSANPAKLLSDLSRKASLRDFSDMLSFRYRFGKEFRDVCETLRTRRNPGLVILIDDLDRCQPDAVLKILEAVNYFVSEGPCFVVLGMDRRQVEHAVGHGFKDIVEGLPEAELIYENQLQMGNSDEDIKVIKRRAYARHYLEKLINIDVPVPTLSSDGAVRMLLDELPVSDNNETPAVRSDEPPWLVGFKNQVGTLVGVARVAVFSVALGLAAALLLEPYVGLSPVGALQQASAVPTESESSTSVQEAEQPVVERAEEIVRFGEAIPPELLAGLKERPQIPSPRRYLWWGGTAFVLLIALLFGVAEVVRRERTIVRDSPDFAKALAIVLPLIHAANPTPRAIKLYENRMRYLATTIGTAAQPRVPDLVDRILYWWGQRRGKEYVPTAWFKPPEPLLSEPKLLMLGALDTYEPKVFQFDGADLDSLADSVALKELVKQGAAGDENLLLDTVKKYANLFGSDPRTALQVDDFAMYDKKIRKL